MARLRLLNYVTAYYRTVFDRDIARIFKARRYQRKLRIMLTVCMSV